MRVSIICASKREMIANIVYDKEVKTNIMIIMTSERMR